MPSNRPSEERRQGDRSILRAASDELGITTPKVADRPRRKGPIRAYSFWPRRGRDAAGGERSALTRCCRFWQGQS